MSIKNMSNEDLIKLKSVYSKINSFSCVVGFFVALGGAIINLVIEFYKDANINVCFVFSIIIGVIAFIALILMIISWVMLRKIEKRLKSFNLQNLDDDHNTSDVENVDDEHNADKS